MGEYITATEASRRFAISERTVRNWLKKGKLPAQKVKVDGLEQWQIDIEDIEQFIARKHAGISSTGTLPEEIITRFEQIEQRLEAIEKRLDALTRSQTQESLSVQPPAQEVSIVRAALSSLKKLAPSPDEPIFLNQFADLHGVSRNESNRLWRTGFIAGRREPGKRRGSVIIDAAGMHDFWVQFHDHPEFRACDTCPH